MRRTDYKLSTFPYLCLQSHNSAPPTGRAGQERQTLPCMCAKIVDKFSKTLPCVPQVLALISGIHLVTPLYLRSRIALHPVQGVMSLTLP